MADPVNPCGLCLIAQFPWVDELLKISFTTSQSSLIRSFTLHISLSPKEPTNVPGGPLLSNVFQLGSLNKSRGPPINGATRARQRWYTLGTRSPRRSSLTQTPIRRWDPGGAHCLYDVILVALVTDNWVLLTGLGNQEWSNLQNRALQNETAKRRLLSRENHTIQFTWCVPLVHLSQALQSTKRILLRLAQ